MERRAKLTPMKRNVTLDDVAEAVFVLATSLQFVTGEIIVVDGGFTATT
jgi:3-oxoacyl-[acyl-carrier protein] reductase